MFGTVTPGPVALALARRVEAGGGSETQQVLQGNHGEIGGRAIGSPEKIPRNVVTADAKIAAYVIAGVLANRRIPTAGRVVVVRAGIDDGVVAKIVREVEVVGFAAEGELEDRHARETCGLAQSDDRRSEFAKIFRDEFGLGQGSSN